MAKKQKKITLATYNSLLGFSAIPVEHRIGFLSELLKRKNASSQKNVLLLKLIFSFIQENKISSWNPEAVCRELNTSMDTLYKHKSRLLDGLRKYYFKWNDNKRHIEYSYKNSDCSRAGKIMLNLELARKMWETGLRRESVMLYRKMIKEVEGHSESTSEKLMYLFEIYEYHAMYYTVQRKITQTEFYIKKLQQIYKELYRGISSQRDQALLEIRFNYRLYQLLQLKWNLNRKRDLDNSLLERMYGQSKKFKFHNHLLRVLFTLATHSINTDNYIKANIYSTEGYRTAKGLNYPTEENTFASLLYFLKTKHNIGTIRVNINYISEYYNKVRATAPMSLWTHFLENGMILSYYSDKKPETMHVFNQLIDSSILKSDFSFAVYTMFKLNSEIHYKNMLSYIRKNIHEDYPEMGKIERNILDDSERTCFNTLCYHSELNNQSFIWDVYSLQLTAKFFNEDGFDIDDASLIIRKMEWLKKEKRKKITELVTYELLKLCIKMLEHADDPEKMLSRYEYKFKTTIDELKSGMKELDVIDYAIISSLARRLGINEITEIVRDFYGWLQTHHPEILAQAFSELKEHAKAG